MSPVLEWIGAVAPSKLSRSISTAQIGVAMVRAAAALKPGDFDWEKIFRDGVRWAHSGGIFASLSETTSDLILEMMAAAGEAGTIRSVDLNYRGKLWAPLGGAAQAQRVMRNIVRNVDVLIGNEEDLQTALGIKGPEVGTAKSKLDTSTFFAMIEENRTMSENLKKFTQFLSRRLASY